MQSVRNAYCAKKNWSAHEPKKNFFKFDSTSFISWNKHKSKWINEFFVSKNIDISIEYNWFNQFILMKLFNSNIALYESLILQVLVVENFFFQFYLYLGCKKQIISQPNTNTSNIWNRKQIAVVTNKKSILQQTITIYDKIATNLPLLLPLLLAEYLEQFCFYKIKNWAEHSTNITTMLQTKKNCWKTLNIIK